MAGRVYPSTEELALEVGQARGVIPGDAVSTHVRLRLRAGTVCFEPDALSQDELVEASQDAWSRVLAFIEQHAL